MACLIACGGSEVADEEASSGSETIVRVEVEQDEPAIAQVTIPAEPILRPGPREASDEVAVDTSIDAPVADAEGEVREGLEGGLAALGAAMSAAQGATGGTACETAYNGALAMVNALRAHSNDASTANIPSEADFLLGCNGLTFEAQQCMTMTYAMANQAQCGAVMQTPEVQAFRQSMRPNP